MSKLPVLLLLCLGGAVQSQSIDLDWNLVSSGFSEPLLVTHAGDGSGRIFVVEQRGRIRIIDASGTLLTQDFLNLGSTGLDRVSQTGLERGLLGLAFHPQYAANGHFFVNYTIQSNDLNLNGDTLIAEYHVSSDPNIADPTETIVMGPINQPFENHNGGCLAFGPEGDLYIGLGDGGSGGDPYGNGQNINTFLGKILRINVDSATQAYSIPPDNPFAGAIAGLDEIYAYGLRNPWRFSFDRMDGRLFCGDVGQNLYEEVDLIQKGDNHGWRIMEGLHCFSPPTGCDMTGLVLPLTEYDHTLGTAVTGGYVYRGSLYPDLFGLYFFSDSGSGRIWSLSETSPGVWTRTERRDSPFNITSFGEDEAGEVYFTAYNTGEVYHLFDNPITFTPSPPPTVTRTPTSTRTKTSTRTQTPSPTITATRTTTETPSHTSTGASTATPSIAPTLSNTPVPTQTATTTTTSTSSPTSAFSTQTFTKTDTPSPTESSQFDTPTPTATGTETIEPTPSATQLMTATKTLTPASPDLNHSESVDAIDLVDLLRQLHSFPPGAGFDSADLTGDGFIRYEDMFLFLAAWGQMP